MSIFGQSGYARCSQVELRPRAAHCSRQAHSDQHRPHCVSHVPRSGHGEAEKRVNHASLQRLLLVGLLTSHASRALWRVGASADNQSPRMRTRSLRGWSCGLDVVGQKQVHVCNMAQHIASTKVRSKLHARNRYCHAVSSNERSM